MCRVTSAMEMEVGTRLKMVLKTAALATILPAQLLSKGKWKETMNEDAQELIALGVFIFLVCIGVGSCDYLVRL